jgi:hypothetical protein
VLRFFAPEHERQVVCYANAHLTRRAQTGEALQCGEFGQDLTGVKPQWRYFDAQVVLYPELAPLTPRGIWFVTIRRRGAASLRRRSALPASHWRQAVSDTPHRRPQRIRSLDETGQLPGDKGALRPRAVTGLGREPPPWFLSNNAKESARALIVRYARRHRVEDGLGMSVHVFHVDCWARAGRRNVDLDTTMPGLANGCYRWLAQQLRGFDTAAPQQLSRQFVATGGGRNPIGTDRRALRQALPQPDPAGSRSRPTAPGDSLVAKASGGLPVPVSFSGRPKNVDRFRPAEIGVQSS